MKERINIKINRIISFMFVMCLAGIMSVLVMGTDVSASAFPRYNSKKDIEYTNGEGKKVNLKHKEAEPGKLVEYELTDTRITRNATYYMSMDVKFKKSWSWVVEFRNITYKENGEEKSGKMQVNMFGNQCAVTGYGDNWPQYSIIDDNKWHTVTFKSTPTTFEVWIDGVRGTKLYPSATVTDIKSVNVCPAIRMSGYNEGTIKNVKIWNDGEKENPIMPADRVTQSVEALPDVVSLTKNDISKVKSVYADYKKLSAKEKKYVVNYSKLELLVKALPKFTNSQVLNATGTKSGKFTDLFPTGVISHKHEDGFERYLFDTKLTRNSTFYIQCVINLESDSNCFDLCLRDMVYKVNGNTVDTNVSIRIFNHGALLIDQKGNGMSEWVQFKKANVLGTSHILVAECSPTSFALWIDNDKYEFPNINKSAEKGSIKYIAAKPGINLTNEPQGTVSYIQVWNDASTQNTYSTGDRERLAIYNLPELKDLKLSDESKVKQARKMYDALSKSDKDYVNNYEKLQKAERAIALMKDDSEMAKLFLSNSVPKIGKNYINMITTATANINAAYTDKVVYNAATSELKFNVATEYMNIPFQGIEGINAEDTYLIKFVYKPYEYYYESETAAWMGLRITFAGYSPGGNGYLSRNKTQMAFMVRDNMVMAVANDQNQNSEYLSGFTTEIGKTYNVTMLCRQGRLKLWLNGKAVLDEDTLCDYPIQLEFESSRCRCDVQDIQVYNMSNPEVTDLTQAEVEPGFKFIEDTLIDKEGKTSDDEINSRKIVAIGAFVCIGVAVVAIIVVVIVMITTRSKRVKKGEIKDEE